jgi:hypothetical protein
MVIYPASPPLSDGLWSVKPFPKPGLPQGGRAGGGVPHGFPYSYE